MLCHVGLYGVCIRVMRRSRHRYKLGFTSRPPLRTMDTAFIIIALAVVQALCAWWIQARLSASIKHEYDQKLEVLKHEQSRRERAAVIAEFLAEWTHVQEDTKRLNQLLWELCLYLPSPLVRDLKATASKAYGHKTAPQLIVAIRDHLLQGSDPIHEADVVHFKHPKNAAMQSSSQAET
jgi:hypothetical protein